MPPRRGIFGEKGVLSPVRIPGYGGLRPPWGQSLLRSFLASRSFPPPPPAYVLSALGTSGTLIRLPPNASARCCQPPIRNAGRTNRLGTVGTPNRAKPHHAGGG